MKYTMKKTLAFLLTLVMLVNILPVSVLAEQPDEGRRGPLNVQKSRGVNDNYHTVIITVADDVSWNGHLYFVLKQEQVSTPQGNADQYFVGEIQKPGGTVQATTFKAAYWGASDNLYDNTKHVEAKAAVNNWNVNNTINSESPINSSGDVKYIDSINNAPIRISTDDDNNTTTITIGEITTVPVPHTVSIEMHNNGGPIPQINIKNNAYCVVATVNNVAYYGLISEDGTVGKFYSDAGDQTEDGIIPDIADDGSVKIVEYVNGKTAEALAAKTPLAEIERGGPAGPGGPEYYTVTGPELDETANEYCFTLAEKKECKATLTNTTGIDLLNLYALAKVGDTPVAYADLSNLTRSEKTMLSFTDGTQQIKLYNNTTFEIVYYDGNNLNLANLNASNEKLTINNGIVDDIHFEWNSEPTTPSEPPTPDNPPDRYNIIATLPESTTATLTFDPNTGVTLNGDYYLLVKDSNGNYKYYAPVSDSGLGDFTKTKGTPQANYLVDAASFEFVKAEGTVTGIDDLKELDKIVDGGTIGEYYTVDLPTEAVNGVYAITAEKQENKYYMQYNNAAGGITLAEGSYYYLLATMDGTPVFYTALPTTSGTDPIQFTDGTNTIETLPNVSLSLKQIASAASSLSAFNNIDDAQVITDNEGRKYHISSFEAPHSRSNTNEYNITVDEITAENAVVIDYYNNGQPDTSAANNMTAKYYLEITVDGTSYYAPITIIGSEAVLSEYKKVSDDSSYTIPANKNEIQYSNILKYTGDGELTASYMNEVVNGTKRYYYDPAGLLSTIQVNENTTVDGYDYSFDKIRAEDNNFHITATKRPVYLVKIRTYEQDEETEVTPDFDNGYYIRATINATEGEYKDKPVGWTMVPVTWSGEPVTEVKIQGFVGLNNKPKAFDQNATETALNFDEYYVDLDSIRLCTLKNTDQKPENYNQALNPDDDPNSKIDDAAPDGYKYFDDVSEEEDGSAVIKLKEENQVKYHVRLKFDTLKDSDISVDGGLYVRVTVEHKSGDPTYAYVKVTNDMIRTPDTEHGCTYIDIPIDGESIKWLKADGTPASSQTYTGYEKSTTVELFGVPASVTNPTPGNPGDKLYVDPLRPYYVNKFALTHYPESGEEPDRIKELNKEDGVDYWYDVVELTKDTSKFPSYTLEYILNSYNVVALCDNTEGTDGNPGQGDVNLRVHQMGGVLVRGDLLLGVGGSEGNIPSGIADSRLADKPSVVGGQIIGLTTNGPFVSARGDNYDIVPFYLGSAGNTVIGRIINGSFKGADGQLNNGNLSDPGDPPKATEGVYPNPTEQFRFGLNKAGSTLTSSDYIQWESLQNNILKASDALATDAEYNAAQYAMQHPDATTNPYLLTREDATPKEGKLEFEVTVGDNVIISGIGPDEVIVVRVKGTDECPDPASPTAPGTVINFLEDQNFRIPEIRINNGQSVPTTTENGEGISIVFNYPNCGSDKVIRDCGTTQFGHAVAPKAEIDIVSSNYSGCMVCNNAKIYNEGHMYPYRGDTLVGFHADLKATKLVDGHEPSNKQIYDFKIFSLRSVLTQTQYNNADYWEALPTVNNEGSEVTFKDVSFYAAGKYYFMVYEDTSDLSDKDIPDTRVYLIECEAEKDGKLLKMIEDSIKYYEVLTDDISELVTVTENPAGNGKHFTSIDLTDTDKVAPIGSLSWTSTEDQNGEIETGIEFLNQKLKSGLNIRKEVTGNPTTDPEFTFIVYLWEEIEEDGTVTYSYIDPDENNIVIKKYSNGTETTLDTDFSAQGTYSDGNGEHIANIATLTLKRNESLNINGIIVDTHYAVLEKVNGSNTPLNGNNEVIENYTLISVGDNTNTPEDGVQGVISNDANASVIIQFTNEYTEEKGSLTVKKQITGISGQDSKAYPITIKATVDGATKFVNADGEFVDTDPGLTVSVSTPVVIDDLPLDIEYTVAEVLDDDENIIGNFTLSEDSETSGSATLTRGETTQSKTVTLINDYVEEKGSLTVKKQITGISGQDSKAYPITIKATVDGATKFVNADGEFVDTDPGLTVSVSTPVVIDDLPLDIEYTVAEVLDDDENIIGNFTLSEDSETSGSATLTRGETTQSKTVTLINDYVEEKGSLTVKKQITGISGQDSKAYPITIKATVDGATKFVNADGEFVDTDPGLTVSVSTPVVIDDLPLDIEYTVAEVLDDDENIIGNFTLSEDSETSGSATLTRGETTQSKTVTLINDYVEEKGSLTVKKQITGISGQDSKAYPITIKATVDGATKFVNADGEFVDTDPGLTVSVSTPVVIDDLPLDIEYTVAEVLDDDENIIGNFTLSEDSETSGSATLTRGETTQNKTITLINKYIGEKGILTVKKQITGISGQDSKAYPITIKATVDGATKFVNADGEFVDTDPGLTVSVSTPVVIDDLPLDIEYTVAEVLDDDENIIGNFTLSEDSETSGSATLTRGETTQSKTVTLINDYVEEKGSLTVKKQITGITGQDSKAYPITIKATVDGATKFINADGEFVDTDPGLTVSVSTPVVIDDLPLDIEYTVAEVLDDDENIIGNFTLSEDSETSGSATLTRGKTTQSKTVTLINDYVEEKGSLTVKKQITGITGQDSKAYPITIKATVDGATKFVNADGEFVDTDPGLTVSVSTPVVIDDLPLDIEYTVAEVLDDDENIIGNFTLSEDSETSGSATLTRGETTQSKTVTLINDYVEEKGSLTVKKQITGISGQDSKAYPITIKATVDGATKFVNADGEFVDTDPGLTVSVSTPVVIDDLPLDIEYTVAEVLDDDENIIGNFTLSEDSETSGSATLTRGETTQSKTVTLINDYVEEKGSLTVKKQITGITGQDSKAYPITIKATVDGATKFINADGEFVDTDPGLTVSVSTPVVIDDLPLDIEYTVAEVLDDDENIIGNFTLSEDSETSGSATLTRGETTQSKTVTLINDYVEEKGSLTVKKQITGITGQDSKAYPITIKATVDGATKFVNADGEFVDTDPGLTVSVSTPVVIDDLPLDIEYTVAEVLDDDENIIGNFTLSEDSETSGSATLTRGETTQSKTVTLINDYVEEKGSLTVKKQITGISGQDSKAYPITIKATVDGATKFVNADGEFVDTDPGLTVSVSTPVVIDDLPLDIEYTVAEVLDDDENIIGNFTLSEDSETSGSATLTRGETTQSKTVTLINDYVEEKGSLTVKKQITGISGQDSKAYPITIKATVDGATKFINADGEFVDTDPGLTVSVSTPVVIDDLPLDIEYTVAEVLDDDENIIGNFTLSEDSETSGSATLTRGETTQSKTVTLINDYVEEKGSLTVKKQITGISGQDSKAYPITIKVTVDGATKFVNADGEFVDTDPGLTVSVSTPVVIDDLPLDIEYTVAEVLDDDENIIGNFTLSEDSETSGSATLTRGETTQNKTITLINKYIGEKGILTVKKQITGISGQDSKAYPITIKATVDGTTKFVNADGEFVDTDPGLTVSVSTPVVINDLPLDIEYTVAEVLDDDENIIGNFTLSEDSETSGSATLTRGETTQSKTVTLINDYVEEKGSLTVKKQITGITGQDSKAYPITIKATVDGATKFINADGEFVDTDPGLTVSVSTPVVIDDLPLDIEYTVAEVLDDDENIIGNFTLSEDSETSGSATLTRGETTQSKTVTLINDYVEEKGSLTVKKQITGISGQDSKAYPITIKATVDGATKFVNADGEFVDTDPGLTVSVSTPVVIDDLPLDIEYTVAEVLDDDENIIGNFTLSEDSETSGSATLTRGETTQSKTVTLINDYVEEKGSLTVKKQITGISGQDSKAYPITIKVTVDGATKFVNADGEFVDTDPGLTVSVSTPVVIDDLPLDIEYTVAEVLDDDENIIGNFTLSEDSETSGSATLTRGETTQNKTITLINKYIGEKGILTVKKQITGITGQDSKAYPITIKATVDGATKFINADGEFVDTDPGLTVSVSTPVVIDDLPLDIEYTVAEVLDDDENIIGNFTLSEDSETSGSATLTRGETTQSKTVTLINDYVEEKGSLTVKKQITGISGQDSKAYPITIKATVDGATKFVNADGEFVDTDPGLTVSVSTPVVIDDLPLDIEYTVAEVLDDDENIIGNFTLSEDSETSGSATLTRGETTQSKTVTLINDYVEEKGSLTVKKQITGISGQDSKAYPITIKATVDGATKFVNADGEFVDTDPGLTVSVSTPVVIDDLPLDIEYTVAEVLDDDENIIGNFTLSEDSETSGSATLTRGETTQSKTVTLINDYVEEKGSLTVKKQITGISGQDSKAYPITIKATVDGATKFVNADGEFVDTDPGLTVSVSTPVVIDDLPLDIEYTVAEVLDDDENIIGNFTLSEDSETSGSATLTRGETTQSKTVTLINDYVEEKGSLTVKKQITGITGQDSKAYPITIKATVDGATKFVNADGEFVDTDPGLTVSVSTPVVIDDLPLDIEYTVAEVLDDDENIIGNFTLSEDSETSGSATLTRGETTQSKTVTLINDYVEEKGSLTVKKQITGISGQDSKAYPITIKATVDGATKFVNADGEFVDTDPGLTVSVSTPVVIDDLPLDIEYTVAEVLDDDENIIGNFTLSEDSETSGSATLTRGETTQSKTVTLINDYVEEKGSLTVKKQITGISGQDSKAYPITIKATVDGATKFINADGEFVDTDPGLTVSVSTPVVIDDLPLDIEYTVAEVLDDDENIIGNFTLSEDSETSGSATLTRGETTQSKTVTLINDYVEEKGSLTVKKQITGISGQDSKAYPITIKATVDGATKFVNADGEFVDTDPGLTVSVSTPVVIDDLPLDIEYTVAEVLDDDENIIGNFTLSEDSETSGSATLTRGETTQSKTVTLINDYVEEKGSLTVKKQITGITGQDSKAYPITIKATVDGATKFVNADGEFVDTDPGLTVSVSTPVVIDDLPLDIEYTVAEVLDDDENIIGNFTLSEDSETSGSATLTRGETTQSKTVTLINDYVEEKGSLTVKKQITGISGQDSKAYPITIKATVDGATKFVNADGEFVDTDPGLTVSVSTPVVIDDLPLDIEYTVAEVLDDDENIIGNFTLSEDSETSGSATLTRGETTQSKTVTLINDYVEEKGSLTVKKQITGISGQDSKAYPITIKATVDGATKFINADGEFVDTDPGLTVSVSTPVVIDDLPLDIEYTVAEVLDDDENIIGNFTLSEDSETSGSATLTRGETTQSKTVTLINDYVEEKGSLTVKKQITGISGQDSKAYPITIKATVDGATKFVNADGEFVDTDPGLTVSVSTPVVIDDLPLDIEYTVAEVLDDDENIIGNFTLKADGENGSTTSGKATLTRGTETQSKTVTLINAYEMRVGSVKVTKIFDGITELPAGFKITNDYNKEEFTALNAKIGDGINTPFKWEIKNVPVNTVITFTESSADVEGFNLTASATSITCDAVIADKTVTAEFTNTYERKTGTAAPEITKKMEGDDAKEAPDGVYVFKLTPVDNAPMPEKDEASVSLKKGEIEGTAAFGEITYDTVGTYTYEITEVPGNTPGMKYADGKVTVTVTVTEDATELTTAVAYKDGIKSLTNTYKKPDKPSFEKKIQDTNDTTGETSGWQDSADYDIGDSVPYKLTAVLANNVTDYLQYHVTFHDKMEKGLTFEKIQKVEVNGEALPENGYTLKKISDQEFDLTVTFNDGKSKITNTALNNGTVEVYFTAILNGNAVIGGHGNVNTGKLEYSCNPSVDENGKPSDETEETEEDSVICFTYKVDVNKVDPDGKALAGAAFKLEKKLKDGMLKLIECVTASEGTAFSFAGLDDGDYILTETKVPEGYKGIDPVTFTVTAEHEVNWTDADKRDDVLTKLTGDVPSGELVFTVDSGTGSLTADVENGMNAWASATVKKIWKDENNSDGIRPTGLAIELLADGEPTGLFANLNAENNWIDRIDNLPKCKDGRDIVYSWKEPNVVGYTLTGTTTSGSLTTLTNTHEAEKTTVEVKKVWVDNGEHPADVEVQLYADGKALGDTVKLNADNGWKYSWSNLCRNVRDDGVVREIKYTVAETKIPEGYVAKITGNASTGFVITNTKETGKLVIEKEFDIRIPEEEPEEEEMTTDIEVVKIWDDNDNKDGNRPKSITVHLYAGGEEVRSAKLTAANGWKHKFGELPKFVNGHPITYTVKEDPVRWYVAEIHGYTIRNKYQPEMTSVSVRKVWDDNNNEHMYRPTSVHMTLSNGMSVVLNEQNGWMASITGLPTMVNGQPAVYTWTEQEVIGYELESVVTEGSVTTFTNKPWNRPDKPTEGKTPRLPGEDIIIEEYETPLGVDVIINHVGDCFD